MGSIFCGKIKVKLIERVAESMGIQENILADINNMRFNPMNDVIFKFVFGKEERKQITIDFLNTVLADDLGHPIGDIKFNQTENSPENDNDKLTRLDVVCTLDTGEKVDVEVQVANQHNITQRTLYYWSQMYLMSLPTGKNYQDLRPAITINILNFKALPQLEPHSMYSIYNPKTGDRLNNDLELHFLELPKFVKDKPVAQMTQMERWLAYFSRNIDRQDMEGLAMNDVAIMAAIDAANMFLQDPVVRHKYINREMARMDNESEKRYWQEKLDKAEKAERAAMQVYRDLLSQGVLTLEQIAATGRLSAEQMATLRG